MGPLKVLPTRERAAFRRQIAPALLQEKRYWTAASRSRPSSAPPPSAVCRRPSTSWKVSESGAPLGRPWPPGGSARGEGGVEERMGGEARVATEAPGQICQQAPGPSHVWNARVVRRGQRPAIPLSACGSARRVFPRRLLGRGFRRPRAGGRLWSFQVTYVGPPRPSASAAGSCPAPSGLTVSGGHEPGCPASTCPRRAACPGGLGSAPRSGPLLAPTRQTGPHGGRSQAEPRGSGHRLK